MTQGKGAERRTAERFSKQLTFRIDQKGFDISAETVNISKNGALCEVQSNMPLMTTLDVDLFLPTSTAKSKEIRLKGVLVRKEKNHKNGHYFVAIYFSEIAPGDQKTLEEYLFNHRSV